MNRIWSRSYAHEKQDPGAGGVACSWKEKAPEQFLLGFFQRSSDPHLSFCRPCFV